MASISATPRKTCLLSDACILCGFCFKQIEYASDGSEKIQKFSEIKLRLNEERWGNIRKLTGVLTDLDEKGLGGVCKKCYRQVESVLKIEAKNAVVKERFREMAERTLKTKMLQLPSPRRTSITKRMLRSPDTHVPSTKKKSFDVSVVKLVQLTPFKDLTNTRTDSSKAGLPMPVYTACIPIAPQEKQVEGASTNKKGSKRSLDFETNRDQSDIKPTPVDGSIEISIYYPSGRKSRFITDEKEKKVCKIVFRGNDIGSGLRDFLKTSHPEELIEGSVAILGDECKTLCKRNSGSVLQDKSIQNVMEFTWDKLYTELQIRAPNILKIVSAMVNDIPIQVNNKPFQLVMYTLSQILHARSQEMSLVQYLSGLVLMHGGCTLKDIERIAKFGASVHPETLRRKLNSWDEYLDEELLKYKTEWSRGGNKKYQLIGDNWDRNIIPSYRTSQDKTLSLHLFQVIGVVDRVDSLNCAFDPQLLDILELTPVDFIPSVADQDILLHELTFLVANAVIANIEQLNGAFGYIYPKHLKHKYSEFSGMKTEQYSLGLFDCNEMVTQDVIRLLKDLSKKYVPIDDAGEIVEEVFFGGDRLTDERIQSAQEAMTNNENPLDKFEGFISKIEDFHRLMNFLEAIVLQTYSTQSANDRGTVYYYKNILNARNVKGKVKNSYRGYKMLYRTIFDAMCCAFFLKEFGLLNLTESIPLPDEFSKWTGEEKIQWMNNICERIVNKWFFGDSDLFEELRQVLSDPDHEENYWFGNFKDGRFSCHYCEKTYCHIKSAEFHEKEVHGHSKPALRKSKQANLLQDELFDYLIALFRLSALHRNLDTAVDMADGYRSIRSAKYETPLYNKTHKTKYLIGSIHLTGLVSGTLPPPQTERLIANRCINLSGGKNSNMALDEYVELVNRDTKNTCSGFQTKESIIAHSKQFPLLIKAVKNLDMINDVHRRKGFHSIPSYKSDVRKIVQDLFDIDGFSQHKGRKLKCRELVQKSNPFADSYIQLVNMIYRHKPLLPFRRLRNKQL